MATILIRKLEVDPTRRDTVYAEILDLLLRALKGESSRNRTPTPHVYAALVNGTRRFLQAGGRPSDSQRAIILPLVEKAQTYFHRDEKLLQNCDGLVEELRAPGPQSI